MSMIRQAINDTSYLYEGEEEEKGNSGWKNKFVQEKMRAVGWTMGQAWCSYAAELIWREAYGKCNSLFDKELDKLFSANAVRTFDNFIKAGWEFSTTPEKGDLVVWKSYKNGQPRKSGKWFLGHIGVVTVPASLFFLDMEGNTNSQGGREGFEWAERKRKYDFDNNNGLRLLGFIKPKEA